MERNLTGERFTWRGTLQESYWHGETLSGRMTDMKENPSSVETNCIGEQLLTWFTFKWTGIVFKSLGRSTRLNEAAHNFFEAFASVINFSIFCDSTNAAHIDAWSCIDRLPQAMKAFGRFKTHWYMVISTGRQGIWDGDRAEGYINFHRCDSCYFIGWGYHPLRLLRE